MSEAPKEGNPAAAKIEKDADKIIHIAEDIKDLSSQLSRAKSTLGQTRGLVNLIIQETNKYAAVKFSFNDYDADQRYKGEGRKALIEHVRTYGGNTAIADGKLTAQVTELLDNVKTLEESNKALEAKLDDALGQVRDDVKHARLYGKAIHKLAEITNYDGAMDKLSRKQVKDFQEYVEQIQAVYVEHEDETPETPATPEIARFIKETLRPYAHTEHIFGKDRHVSDKEHKQIVDEKSDREILHAVYVDLKKEVARQEDELKGKERNIKNYGARIKEQEERFKKELEAADAKHANCSKELADFLMGYQKLVNEDHDDLKAYAGKQGIQIPTRTGSTIEGVLTLQGLLNFLTEERKSDFEDFTAQMDALKAQEANYTAFHEREQWLIENVRKHAHDHGYTEPIDNLKDVSIYISASAPQHIVDALNETIKEQRTEHARTLEDLTNVRKQAQIDVEEMQARCAERIEKTERGHILHARHLLEQTGYVRTPEERQYFEEIAGLDGTNGVIDWLINNIERSEKLEATRAEKEKLETDYTRLLALYQNKVTTSHRKDFELRHLALDRDWAQVQLEEHIESTQREPFHKRLYDTFTGVGGAHWNEGRVCSYIDSIVNAAKSAKVPEKKVLSFTQKLADKYGVGSLDMITHQVLEAINKFSQAGWFGRRFGLS